MLNSIARWEVDQDYCTNTVMRTPPYSRGPRLMSIIDTAIFDYFIGKLYSLYTANSMDHSPIRQTFELGQFISTAGKSIINLVKL